MKESKQCGNCARWTKPLIYSACSYTASVYKLDFKKNEKGMYYCDDFKSKLENKE